MSEKLNVGNLHALVTSDDLRQLFAGAGEVAAARVILDRETRRSKGFAFVEMADREMALKAIALYNGFSLHDQAMIVSEARPREPQPQYTPQDRVPAAAQPKFREIKHKSRGGARRRF